MSKNIFYVSNTQTELFPNNKRDHFDQYIDIHSLDYIKHDNIEVAVKSISFDNKQGYNIKPNINQPHFIIIQDKIPEDHIFNKYNEIDRKGLGEKIDENTYDKRIEEGKTMEETFDLNLNNDYIILNPCDTALFVERRSQAREFSNIIYYILYGDTPIFINHIYLHKAEYFFLDHFINNLNYKWSKIITSLTTVDKRYDLIRKEEDVYELDWIPYRYFIHGEIAKLLDISEGEKISINLSDVLNIDGLEPDGACGKHFQNEMYKLEQNVVYNEILPETDETYPLYPELFPSIIYGLRSNISEPTIKNSKYDTIVALFQHQMQGDVLNIKFKNPSFFKTRKELLSNANFEIIDLTSKKSNRRSFGLGSPTYIQTIVREASYKIKRPFTIFLDSSDVESKQLYPNNTSTDFTIELPERLKFNRNWTVSAKSLFLSNKIHNIEDCYVLITTRDEDRETRSERFTLKNGNYTTIEIFLNELQNVLKKGRIPVDVGQNENGRVRMTWGLNIKKRHIVALRLSRYLACILGYTSSPKTFQSLRFDQHQQYIAPHDPNMFLTYPKNLIIGCDIVDDTIFGGQHVKLLRLVNNTTNLTSDILTFDFQQDEKVPLNIREFKSIHISILDASGNPVKNESNFSTKLQLQFSLEGEST